MDTKKTKVVVLGGGFGGIKTALELSDSPDFLVTLISDSPDFRYYPALYHSATGGNPIGSSIPLAEIFKGRNLKIVEDRVIKLDRQSKTVSGKNGDYKYDKLVVALGVVTNYFGIKGLDKYSYGIKTQADAKRLRDHIHDQLISDGKPDLNYVVIGGGPTGIELAGALPDYVSHVIKMHNLKPRRPHIDLVEAAPRLMPRMPSSYSRAVAKRLRKLGVSLYLHQAVQAETADALIVEGHPITSHTVIWTAGVTNNPFFSTNGFDIGDHGKVHVDQHLMAESDIFVIGDNAETPFSGMAQTALHDAKFVADNLKRLAAGKRQHGYAFKKPVYVTPAGEGWAAVLWNNFHVYGRLGWLLRSAADARGYHDYEPWWTASKHWLAEYQAGHDCTVCAGQSQA